MKLILFLVAVTLVSGSPVRLLGRDHHELSCSICQHLTQDLHHVMSAEDTQSKVVSGLQSRCNVLVSEQNEVCKDIVQSMAPNMVNFITNKIHPYIMCSSLEMCPEEHVPEEHLPVEHVQEEHVQEQHVPERHAERVKFPVDPCEFCQFAINIVERYAHANGSIAKLNATLNRFCDSLPDPFKTECMNFTPAVIKALAEGVPPHQACVKAHICPSGTIEYPLPWKQVTCEVCNGVTENMFGVDAGAVCMDLKICLRPTQPSEEKEEPPHPREVEVKELGAGPACELCEFVVNTIDTYLKDNHTEAAINATITKLCNDLPEPLKDTCNEFAPQLIKILAQGFDPAQACSKIGMCETEKELQPRTEKVLPQAQVEVKAGPGCELCQFVVNVIDQYLEDNHTEAAINATVTKICNELPEPLKDTCNGFAPQLIQILSQGLDPKQACTKIKLCSAAKLVREHRQFTEEEWDRLQAGPGCELCQFVVNVLDQYLKDNHTEAAINATLTKICNELPDPLKSTCIGFEPQLIKILAQGFDPQQACTKIGLCSTSVPEEVEEDETEEAEERPEEVEVNVEAGPACELCQFVVNTIDTYLKDNHTEAAINATITKLCNDLPEPLKDTCIGFEPQLIKILAQGFDPTQACTKIGLCASSQNQPMPVRPVEERKEHPVEERKEHPVEERKEHSVEEHEEHLLRKHEEQITAGPACELCQFVVNTIDTYLKDNHTEAAINATITKLCNDLPEPLKDTCIGFEPQLIKILAQGFDPTQACTKIGLCASSQNQPMPVRPVEEREEHPVEEREEHPVEEHGEHLLREHEEQITAGPACELCQFVVNTIDTYLKDNHTEAAINATITKLCNDLPEPLKDTCIGFEPQLIKILAQGFDPTQACTKIGLCASSQYQQMPVHPVEERKEQPVEERVEHLVRQHEVQTASELKCGVCEFLVDTMYQYLQQNHSLKAINTTVYKICRALPEQLKRACFGLAPKLVKTFANGTDSLQACKKIGVCPAEEHEELPVEEHAVQLVEENKERGVPGCELCQFVVNTIDTYLKDNHTEAAINATITKICNDLPEPLKDTCTGFESKLVKILAQGLDPKQACTKIKLCAGVEHELRPVEVNEESHTEDHRVIAGPGCELCQFVVNTIDTYLKDNHTEAAINATLYNMCNDLPEPLKDTCIGFAPDLEKILAQGLDPKQACTKIGLCASTELENKPNEIDLNEATPECELCELIMKTVDKYLTLNATEAIVNTTILRVCLGLPEPLKSTCLQHAPALVQAISKGVDPKMACSKIKLCSDNEVPAFHHLTCDVCESSMERVFPESFKKVCSLTCTGTEDKEKVLKGFAHEAAVALKKPESAFTCELCLLLVRTLDTYLKDNHSEAAINSTIYKICASLPTDLQLECHLMAPLLVKQLANGFNATKACTAIHACAGEKEEVLYRVVRALQEKTGSIECSACKALIGFIDTGIDGDEAKTKKMFDDVCHRLPPPSDQKCLDFVDPNFPKIWDEIVHGKLSPQKVCETLKVCTDTAS